MSALCRVYPLLVIFATTALGASNDEFLSTLRELVNDLLGTEEFQV